MQSFLPRSARRSWRGPKGIRSSSKRSSDGSSTRGTSSVKGRVGRWWPDSMPTPLPDTIHAVIAARIDALEPGEKRALQEASVLGRTFWEEPVALAVGQASPTASEASSARA